MLGTGLGQPGRTWPDVGEIDILEYVGREPNVVIGALHGPGYSGGNAIDQWSLQSAPLAGTWHVVAVEWNYNGITWFLDGNEFHHVSRDDPPGAWVFDQDFFIILNLAIGGTLGGDVDPNLVFPLRYEIDYVRVYQ
jgi:beta-glucanase (GH16 family)